MTTVGGGEPKATHRANGPTRVTDADPLEQPSLPLTTLLISEMERWQREAQTAEERAWANVHRAAILRILRSDACPNS